ncbi:hypothetical protein ACIQPR_47920 [Streptomyces sp. NPDC091280]|uniref:hypothetical protein n=1 Tax=Streptomyces sp. NPDC091280 TaxID=3365984 RepID=UPI0038234638
MPLTLDDLIDRMLDRERTASSRAGWSELVRAHLYGSGLLAPDAPDEQPFSHKLLDAHFAASHWTGRHPRPAEKDVREIAENRMKSHVADHALFCANTWSGIRPHSRAVHTPTQTISFDLTASAESSDRPANSLLSDTVRDAVRLPR